MGILTEIFSLSEFHGSPEGGGVLQYLHWQVHEQYIEYHSYVIIFVL